MLNNEAIANVQMALHGGSISDGAFPFCALKDPQHYCLKSSPKPLEVMDQKYFFMSVKLFYVWHFSHIHIQPKKWERAYIYNCRFFFLLN